MTPPLLRQILERYLLPIHTAAANFWINTFFQISTRSLSMLAAYEVALIVFTPSGQTVTFRIAISLTSSVVSLTTQCGAIY